MQSNLFSGESTSDTVTKGIGGSELAALFGLHPRLSAEELWRRKTGRPLAMETSAAMRRGVRLEPLVRRLYERHSGARLNPAWRGRHPRWSEGVAMIAATDGMLLDGGIFEAKTTHPKSSRHAIFSQGLVPIEYALQLQHYASVCGVYGGVICCLSGPSDPLPWVDARWDLFVIPWKRLPALGERLEAAVAQWMARHVVDDARPRGVHPEAEAIKALLEGDGWLGAMEHTFGDSLEAEPVVSQLALF